MTCSEPAVLAVPDLAPIVWMLRDRAFGQLASTCRSSGNFMSPYFSMRRATLYRPRRPQGSHSIERVGTRKSESVWAWSLMLRGGLSLMRVVWLAEG
jgi:hypothetical protein